MNPFNNDEFIKRGGISYKSFVENQIMTLAVDESKMVDTGGKSIATFRVNIYQLSLEFFRKFRTKTDNDGNLWVMRVE